MDTGTLSVLRWNLGRGNVVVFLRSIRTLAFLTLHTLVCATLADAVPFTPVVKQTRNSDDAVSLRPPSQLLFQFAKLLVVDS